MGPCDHLDGKPCYYDGSGLNADLLVEGFCLYGDTYVWEKLEAYYRRTFEDADWPDFTPAPKLHPDLAQRAEISEPQ